MSDRDQLYPLDRRAWLLAIGRRLRVEYDAIAPLSTLGVHVRPARSILSNALNFCCSAIAALVRSP
jgi:hypothetical protein